MLLLIVFMAGCSEQYALEQGDDENGHSAPTAATVELNRKARSLLSFDDGQDFIDANRGLIAQEKDLRIHDKHGNVIWDMAAFDFGHQFAENPPDSIHPSLWRQMQLNNIHGLFKVTDGIYQIRGYDLSNMTIIEGDTGWIIVDPLTASETASRALTFAQQHLGQKPIRAILYTHSHIDHFGGVQGVLDHLSEEEKSKLRIIAPKGFMEEATSENIIAGTVMGRRAMHMYGKQLNRSPRGHVDSGLGKGPAFGTFGLFKPNEIIDKTGTELNIDGVPFVFQYTPESEAPAEFTFYLPEQKAFCGAELVSRNMHNLYTLRGAKVRNALVWSDYIEEARLLFSDAQVYFASHHWPLWGAAPIQSFLVKQRDTYKYIHDQSVRLMNTGLTPNEIAEQIRLPESLQNNFPTRGYYGTLKHNAKAVYQHYMGWYTGNPAGLDPLPESDTASRIIKMMGGADQVVASAQKTFTQASLASDVDQAKVEYRWLAQLLNWVVFSNEEHREGKRLLAKVYDQLAYQSESAPWRDVYLSAAFELRHGEPDSGINPATMKHVLVHAPVEKFFDSMAANMNGPNADGKALSIEIHFTDLDKRYLLQLENAVLNYRAITGSAEYDAKLTLTHPLFVDILVADINIKDLVMSDSLSVDGSLLDLISFFALFEKADGTFSIVTP